MGEENCTISGWVEMKNMLLSFSFWFQRWCLGVSIF
jgi:hypothetical protein